MILDENLFEMVAKKEHKKPSARERRKVLESILIEKKLISKKLKENTLTSKGIDGSEMSFDIKDDGTITIYNNGKVVKQSKTDPEYARKVLKDLGFKEKEAIKTESVEGDEIAQANIDSKNMNFEKDKENDRQVKLELAKQGIIKEDISESLKEDLSQEKQQEYGLNTLINQLIKSEYDAIDEYNSAIVTLEAEGQGEYTDVIRSIIEDERHHIGNLQEIMDRITPGTTSEFEKGKEEAEETLGEEETQRIKDVELEDSALQG